MNFISRAELVVLRKMYPEGCRVSLIDMVDEPYANLVSGDLGTVQCVDDIGQIHISWDKGSSVAVIYKVDSCKRLMTEEEMNGILSQIKKMPFESIDRLQAWLEKKMLPIFPKMFIRPVLNGEMLVELGCSAFKMKSPRLEIKFTQDAREHVFIKNCILNEIPSIKKKMSKPVR